MTPKEHLAEIQKRYLNVDPNVANDTANLLDDMVNSIFGDTARIGYELLQNGDDASIGNRIDLDVEFFLLEEHLVIRHNGLEFSPANVEALCRYGTRNLPEEDNQQKEYDKQRNLNKIGYKGIGFKSVFNIADQVWVISKNGYHFRFDKSYWNGRRLPWQIIPIESNLHNLPTNISDYVSTNHVNFILKIKPEVDRKEVKRRMASLFEDEQIIVFLRHTRSMELQYLDPRDFQLKSYRKIIRTLQNDLFTLERLEGGEVKGVSYWHISHFETKIPVDIHLSVQQLDKRLCPEKLKGAQEIEISFAMKLREDGTIIPQDSTPIFSYLPTKKRRNFPFFVNSNFLLNPERTELLSELWNRYLFEQIGYLQFQWYSEMARNEQFRFQFAELIKKYADTTKEPFLSEFNKGVERAQTEIPYVPVIESSELQKSPLTIVDKTRIGKELGEYTLVKESFDDQCYHIADPGIRRINRLIEVGAQNFDQQRLRDAIRRGNHFKSPAENCKLIDFFYKRVSETQSHLERNEWNQVLYETPFLLSQSGHLEEPPALYFPDAIPDLPFKLEMVFLHNEIYREAIVSKPLIHQWLSHLGTTKPIPIEIIKKGIIPLIPEEKINSENCLLITRYVFQHADQLERQDLEHLEHIPVFTTRSTLRKANHCYLSDYYQPQLPLQLHVDDDIYISPDYVENEADLPKWKHFWRRLKVREDMDFELWEGPYPVNQELLNQYEDYWRYLQPKLPQFNWKANHSISVLLIPRYIRYTTQHSFALQYWTIVLQDRWSEVQRKANLSIFSHSNGRSHIPSFFEYLVATHPYFPATDGHCYRTGEVFSHTLSEAIGKLRPISCFELSPHHEKLLGIRNSLSQEDCLKLLNEIAADQENVKRSQITAIYDYMLTNRLLDELASCCVLEEVRLLAVNNTFQEIKNLLFFNLPRFAEKNDSPYIIFMDLKPEDSLHLSKNFGIKVVEQEDLEVAFKSDIQTNSTLQASLENRLSYFAVVIQSKKGKKFEDALTDLNTACHSFDLLSVNELEVFISIGDVEIYRKEVHVWLHEKTIYFLEPWNKRIHLYALCEILAHILDIKGLERELELLLTAPEKELKDWLRNGGYDIEPLEDLKRQENHTSITSNGEDQGPDIETRAGNEMENVVPSKAKEPKMPTVLIQPKVIPEISIEDAKKIGRWGEEYIAERDEIRQYYEKIGSRLVEIIWQNREQESFEPFDFKVSLSSGDVHYWEVKTTPSDLKKDFPISSSEFKFAMENTEHYFIIRIQSAGKDSPSLYIIENPIEAIKQGIIKVEDARLLLEI